MTDKIDDLAAAIDRWKAEVSEVLQDAYVAVNSGQDPNEMFKRATPIERVIVQSFLEWYFLTFPDKMPDSMKH